MEYNNTFYGDAYCVYCKEKITFEGQVKTSDSGRRMAYGKCPQCGNKVNRILGKEPNVGMPPLPQPGVRIVPEPKTYASLHIYRKPNGKWKVDASDSRRVGSDKYEFFTGRYKWRTVSRAIQWLNAWEVIEFKEKY